MVKFPAANISIQKWDKNEDYLIYILEEKFIYTTDQKLFENFFLNNLFVDSNGEVYRIVDRKLPSLTRRIFSFLPNFCKIELLFVPTHDKMTLEEVRQHILNQLVILDQNQNTLDWIHSVKKAKTFQDVIF